MDENYPLLGQYRKEIDAKLKSMKTAIDALKKDYSLHSLNALKNKVHQMIGGAALYGYGEASDAGHELEMELIEKMKNFQLAPPPQTWFSQIDALYHKIEEGFASKQGSPMAESKRKIAIVDDDEDLLRLLTFEFHNLGFEVQAFQTGKTALDFLLKEENLKDVSLIILDRVLPDMDGLEILRKFHKQQKKIPVLILSMLASEKDIVTGLQTGAVDYVTKPFSVFLLMQKAMNLIS